METQEGAERCFPELLNSSCRKPTPSQGETVVLILPSSISLLTVVFNLLVIISVSHFRQLHIPSNLLLLSLAVSDFIVGLVAMPTKIYQQVACWVLGDLLCFYIYFITYIVISASVGNMVLISVDRYFAICHPLHYQTRVTVGRVRLCICVCWSSSVLYNSLILEEYLSQPGRYNSCYGECVVAVSFTAGVVDLILTFIVPISVIVVLYMRVFVVAVSQARVVRSHVPAVTHKQSVKVKTRKSEMKAARTLGVVVVVFIVTFIPYYCVAVAAENLNVQTAVTMVFLSNSCLNPVIYVLFYPWFRKVLHLIVTFQILQPDSSEANIL